MHCPFFHICSSKKIVVKIFTLTDKKCLKNYCSTFLCSSDETILDAYCHYMVNFLFQIQNQNLQFFCFFSSDRLHQKQFVNQSQVLFCSVHHLSQAIQGFRFLEKNSQNPISKASHPRIQILGKKFYKFGFLVTSWQTVWGIQLVYHTYS